LDPNKPYDVWRDLDGDHLPHFVELLEGFNPDVADNDIFSNNRILVVQAINELYGTFATQDRIDVLLKMLNNNRITPVNVYQFLLYGEYFSRMGFIGRVYQAVLLRSPDLDGARYYHHQLGRGVIRGGLSKRDMINQFVQSKEFDAFYGDLPDADFIHLVHQNVLGRTANKNEFDGYQQQLKEVGADRAQVMLALIDSKDYIKAFDVQNRVAVLSLLMTGALPDEIQTKRYLQWLENDDVYGLLRDLMTSDAFRQTRMPGISNAMDDTDNDGRPDGAEFVEGFDVDVKDNDVIGNDILFVRQVLRDIRPGVYSEKQVEEQVKLLRRAKGRAAWVKQLFEQHKLSVESWAKVLLKRDASKTELSSWQGADSDSVIEKILNSPQYQARFY
jgi:hypothetical protein